MSSKDLHHRDERLAKYREKRRASGTSEPFGGAAASSQRFVVQKHAARLLHYDFRLEYGGVLWSWAVPKGPSLDPADKRMAVQVEDHPVEYADFEGIIPEKNYGAGEVIVWDKGYWRAPPGEDPEAGLRDGKLTFELYGYKLRGEFALVRTKGDPKAWLLLKHKDAAVKKEHIFDDSSVLSGLTLDDVADGRRRFVALSETLAAQKLPVMKESAQQVGLQLCEARSTAFDDERCLFELKLDGYRLLAEKREGAAQLVYRKKMDATALYPEIALGVSRLPMERFILDGEVVCEDTAGRPNFNRLQKRAMLTRSLDIARAAVELPAVFYVFDLLALDGRDLRRLPLETRKALLRELIPQHGPVRYVEAIAGRGLELMRFVEEMGLEGIVAKRRDAPYRAGRDATWQKVRIEHTADVAIVGCAEVKSVSRVGASSFNFAVRDGDVWRFCGAVGTGLSDDELVMLRQRVEAARCKKPICVGELPTERGQMWSEPVGVLEVRYLGVSPHGVLRQPVCVRLRDDKQPDECTIDQLSGHGDAAPAPTVEAAPVARTVSYSNLGKIFWPERGFSKGDLIEYYRAIAPWLLPFLRDRPVVLTRFPDGIYGKSFFQKDAPEWTPAWVRTEEMWNGEFSRRIRHFIVDDVESLAYIANLGAIPLHIWGSRVGSLERPDWCILDLDPKGAPFTDVVKVARVVHALCEEIELPSYVKTSGSTGIHVLVPLGRQVTFEQAQQLGQLLATVVVERAPDLATIARVVGKREGKVYIDYLQNGHGKLLAAMFCARPVPAASVSMPLKWSEVTAKLDPAKFDLKTAPRRMEKLGDDPLAPVLTDVPDLPAILGRLAGLV